MRYPNQTPTPISRTGPHAAAAGAGNRPPVVAGGHGSATRPVTA
jgi:hypothetical protein